MGGKRRKGSKERMGGKGKKGELVEGEGEKREKGRKGE